MLVRHCYSLSFVEMVPLYISVVFEYILCFSYGFFSRRIKKSLDKRFIAPYKRKNRTAGNLLQVHQRLSFLNLQPNLVQSKRHMLWFSTKTCICYLTKTCVDSVILILKLNLTSLRNLYI